MSIITAYVHSINAKNNSLLCISCSTYLTVYVNKHLSCLTYGRVQTKGRNYVGTRNLRIAWGLDLMEEGECPMAWY